MENSKIQNDLIIPIYINDKSVLDMLAVIEDGFSIVSQVSYTETSSTDSHKGVQVDGGTNASLFEKLLRIDFSGSASQDKGNSQESQVTKEKIHTNVSLLSKLRKYLIDNKQLKANKKIEEINVGDFVEFNGELQKNPLINFFEIFIKILNLSKMFPTTNNSSANKQKNYEKQIDLQIKQVEGLLKEMKSTGTVDFISSDESMAAVLSAQEKYLSNDNISEIIGGRFRILGKVIAVCKNKNDSNNLFRKTTLSVLPIDKINDFVTFFKNDDLKMYNFPELITEIKGPAIIVIPIAIYI